MPKTEYLQGALDLLILKTLALGPNHGWGIQQRIKLGVSRDADRQPGIPVPGTPPARSGGHRRFRNDRLRQQPQGAHVPAHDGGQAAAGAETADWRQFSLAIRRLLELA